MFSFRRWSNEAQNDWEKNESVSGANEHDAKIHSEVEDLKNL